MLSGEMKIFPVGFPWLRVRSSSKAKPVFELTTMTEDVGFTCEWARDAGNKRKSQKDSLTHASVFQCRIHNRQLQTSVTKASLTVCTVWGVNVYIYFSSVLSIEYFMVCSWYSYWVCLSTSGPSHQRSIPTSPLFLLKNFSCQSSPFFLFHYSLNHNP